jgi:hypothetical protein
MRMKLQDLQDCTSLWKKDELTRREPLESIEVKLPLEGRKLGLAEPPATSVRVRTTRVRKEKDRYTKHTTRFAVSLLPLNKRILEC